MRKQPTTPGKKSTCCTSSTTCTTVSTDSCCNKPLPHIATLMNTQPLTHQQQQPQQQQQKQPMVVELPTKPLPAQVQDTSDSLNQLETCCSTSIQISALIQSTSTSTFGLASAGDFMVHATTSTGCHESGLVSNLPLVNNMLMSHYCSSSSAGQNKPTHLLKVDESSDKTPKVGTDYQAADIPDFCPTFIKKEEPGLLPGGREEFENLHPVWHPDTANCLSDMEFNQYLLMASSCAVDGGSHNEEIALEVLQRHGGNVLRALQELLCSSQSCDMDHEDSLSMMFSNGCPVELGPDDFEDQVSGEMLESFTSSTTRQPWQPYEVDAFYEGLVRYHKDFTMVSAHVGTKSVKDCVEFYYMWKNVCYEESQSFKSLFSQSEPMTPPDCPEPSGLSLTNNTTDESQIQHPVVSSLSPPPTAASVV
jgi:hypothetical protein